MQAIKLPCEIFHEDKPDFLIKQSNGKIIGVEANLHTTQIFEHVERIHRVEFPKKCINITSPLDDNTKYKKKDIYSKILPSKINPGYINYNEKDRVWCNGILDMIENKCEK